MTSSRAVLIVPPFLKYSAGPLLGPSLLQSAARSHGFVCDVLDMNAHYIQPRVAQRKGLGNFVGDHDKPTGTNSLSFVEKEFLEQHILPFVATNNTYYSKEELIRKVLFGFLTHKQVREASTAMACQQAGTFGKWAAGIMSTWMMKDHQQNENQRPHRHQHSDCSPNIVGLSLLHSGQVLPATAISKIARELWPEALIVWGGPHISGLGRATLQRDIKKRAFAADIFVTGHAEATFVQILEQREVLKRAVRSSSPVVLDGKSQTIAPTFEHLHLYDSPLTLPAQSTLGCAYGRCAFCTYPFIEDTPQKLDLFSTVGTVVDRAQMMPSGTSVSLKDSLATSTRLTEIGGCIQGRVPWSACTKLSRRLDIKRLADLQENGLATLEVGLETLLPETQRRIDKVQPFELYEQFVKDVAQLEDMSLVVNYMVGFPWEDPAEAQSKLEDARHVLEHWLGSDRGCVELNSFELERMATMAKFPEAYDINPSMIRSWPWASVLELQ